MTAQVTISRCPFCGADLCVGEIKRDVWQMRVDGVIHGIPVFNVPVHACKTCNRHLITYESDEALQYWYNQYLHKHGLDTWRHRARRFMARQARMLILWFYRGPQFRIRNTRNV